MKFKQIVSQAVTFPCRMPAQGTVPDTIPAERTISKTMLRVKATTADLKPISTAADTAKVNSQINPAEIGPKLTRTSMPMIYNSVRAITARTLKCRALRITRAAMPHNSVSTSRTANRKWPWRIRNDTVGYIMIVPSTVPVRYMPKRIRSLQ